MTPLDLAGWAQEAVAGAMPLALPVALLAGLASFFTPCVVPLLPGYLAYATGMSAADITTGTHRRGRAVAGTALFVLGFAAVFVTARRPVRRRRRHPDHLPNPHHQGRGCPRHPYGARLRRAHPTGPA